MKRNVGYFKRLLGGLAAVLLALAGPATLAQSPPAPSQPADSTTAPPADVVPAEAAVPRVNRLDLQIPAQPPGYSSRAEVIARIGLGTIKLIDLKNDPLPAGVKEIKAVEYGRGGDKQLLLDLYLPAESTGPRPGLIFIHGGAWSGGEREVYHYYTKRLAQQGYVAATISYRLSGVAPFPAAVHDCKCAVRWMRAMADKYLIDPQRISVLGGSAGGHLAMMVGYSDDPELEGDGGHAGISSRVASVVNFYGPSDLTTEAARTADPVRKFLGGPFDQRTTLYEQASPLRHVDANDPPTLIIHGTLDELVAIDQSDRLAERLHQQGVPFAYDRLTGWPHTLDVAVPVNEHCLELMKSFLATVNRVEPR